MLEYSGILLLVKLEKMDVKPLKYLYPPVWLSFCFYFSRYEYRCDYHSCRFIYFREPGTVRGSPGQTWCSSVSSRSSSSCLTWSTGGACSAGGATPGRSTTPRTDTASTPSWGPGPETMIIPGSLWGMTPETRGLYSCHQNTIMLLSESGKHRNIDICTRK